MRFKKILNIIGSISCLSLMFMLSPNTEVEAKGVSNIDRAQATVNDMNLEGYTGLKVIDNIEKWQIDSYANNPNIVEAIKAAKTGEVRLSDLQAGDISDYFHIYIKETTDGKVLAYKHKDTGGGNNDVDMKYIMDGSTITDWTGAKELWVYADYSSYTGDEPKLRISFEEKDSINGVRKSWRAKSGVYYIADGTNQKVSASLWDNRVILPKNFKGWVCWTLDEANLQKYWSNGTTVGLELKCVQQFQIGAFGDDNSVGSEYTLDKFTIVGNVDGDAMPVSISGMENYTCKEVWSFENLSLNSYEGSMMAWYGEFPGKLLTGLSLNYLIEPSEDLYNSATKLADDLLDAQCDDGYLGRHTGNARYAINDNNWDVWNNYHCIYGLYRWYKVTGEQKYLDAACKGLDCIINTIGKYGKYYGCFGQEMNMAISHAFVVLYSETGKIDYLQVAEHIILDNWSDYGDWLSNSESGRDYYQSELPRWEALHTIMTLGGLYEATGNVRYYNAFEQIWESILKTDVHNDGGFSSGEGACGDPYNTGAIEACCTIAWMAMTTEFLQVSKRSDVADELERSYYNALLGSIMDDGKYITYDTPMNGIKVPSIETLAFQYNSGSADFTCCQANMARGIGQIADWAVLTDSDTVYLNYYGSSNITALTPSNKFISLKQETNYPSNGKIKITVNLEESETFNLSLRIPTWSESTSIKVNGQSCSDIFSGYYYSINREWHDGDVIELSLDMSVHYWEGQRNFTGYTSVYYGPILLTLDNAYTNLSSQTTTFDYLDIENAQLVESEGSLISLLTRTSNSTLVMLVDFAGAGRSRNKYASWLVVEFEGLQNELVESNKIWNSKLKHNIYYNEDKFTIMNSDNITAGTKVTISVKGKEIPMIYTINGVVEMIKISEGNYSFVMPGCDVYLDIK